MARVVCQVVHKPGRITFLWSEGGASFAPYHLEGVERERFLATADRARGMLAACAQADHPDAGELAAVGAELFRLLFSSEGESSSAPGVLRWWRELAGSGRIETLEIPGNRPGRIPWNLVNEEGKPDGFWGLRFALGVGRRVDPLRTFPWLEGNKPILAWAGREIAGTDQQADSLRRRAQALGVSLTDSEEALLEELGGGLAPDVLALLGRLIGGKLLLGGRPLSFRRLAQQLAENDVGPALPLTLVLAVGAADQADAWTHQLHSLAAALAGAAVCEVPLPAGVALQVAEEILAGFVGDKKTLGEVLREVRVKFGPAAWGLAAYASSALRIGVPTPEEADRFAPTPLPLPEYPYRPFLPMEHEDRPLLVGREAEVIACAGLIDDPAHAGVLVHGRSSNGKTSFLRAGLIPYLEVETIGFRALRDRTPEESATGDQAPLAEADYPVLALRTGPDPIGQIVQALFAFCAQPYEYLAPDGTRVTVPLPDLLRQESASVRTAIRAGIPGGQKEAVTEKENLPPRLPAMDLSTPAGLYAAASAEPGVLAEVVDRITRRLPFELLLVLDQAEDLFLGQGDQAPWRKGAAALNRLAASNARCRLVLSARTDHVGRLLEEIASEEDGLSWSSFSVSPLSATALEDVALTPTASEPPPGTSEIPFGKYQMAFEDGAARLLVDQVQAAAEKCQVGPVALLQVACARMYDRVRNRGDKSIREVDIRELGDLTELLGRGMRDRLLDLQLPLASSNALQNLMAGMVRRESDGTLARRLVREGDLESLWKGPEADLLPAVKTAAAAPVPMLDVQQLLVEGREDIWWSVPHDGLARAVVAEEENDARKKLARSRVIDTLWIMIPLVFLAASLAFFLTRQFGGRAAGAAADPEKIDPKILEALDEEFQRQMAVRRWSTYPGDLARAQQALAQGNALAARQILLLQQPGRVPTVTGGVGPAEKDLRGFEWYWLWRQLHQEKAALLGHQAPLTGIAATEDGKLLASSSADGAIKLWSGKSLDRLTEVPRGKDPVHALALSADGKLLAAGGPTGLVRVWEVALDPEGKSAGIKESRTLQAGKGAVLALRFAKEQGLLLAGTQEGEIKAWETAAGKEKFAGKRTTPIRALVVLPGGKVAASADPEGQVALWNLESGKETQAFTLAGFGKGKGELQALAVIPDGSLLAACGSRLQAGVPAGLVGFVDPATGKEKLSDLTTDRPLLSLAFLPEGKTLALGGQDRLVRLVDLDEKAGTKNLRLLPGHYGWVEVLAAVPDGSLLLSGSRDGTIKAWPLKGATYPDRIHLEGGAVRSLALAPKDGTAACGMESGAVHLVDMRTGETRATLKGEGGAVSAVSLAATGDSWLLAIGTWDPQDKGKIAVWEITAKDGETPKATRKHLLEQHGQAITCLAFSPDGRTLASGSLDRTALLWDVEAGKPRKEALVHQAPVTSLAYDANGHALLTGDETGILRCWNTEEGKLSRAPLLAHSSALDAVAFLDQDRLMATGARDGMSKVLRWDEASKKYGLESHTSGHGQPIRCLAVGPKGGFFVTGSMDRTLKVWEAGRERPSLGFGRERITLTGHAAPVLAAVLAKDGLTLVSGDASGELRFWRSTTEERSYATRRD